MRGEPIEKAVNWQYAGVPRYVAEIGLQSRDFDGRLSEVTRLDTVCAASPDARTRGDEAKGDEEAMRVVTYILCALAGPSMFGLLLIALGGLDWGVRAVALFTLIGLAAVAMLTLTMTRTVLNAFLEKAGIDPDASGIDPEAAP